MSTTFIATLLVKQGREAEFERLQKELSELTHAGEPGTLVYDVIKSRSKPRTYVVYGRFKDEAAFQLHQSSSFHDKLVPPILACVEGDMDLQLLDWKS
ncbi:MAG TPA: antibiotic biosynthesis monooxygenase family protein [Steroidobacteraceae bacterium]|nr:antibiotic biosynthesis monooxygenase family protein [Steroidobacteraceae bacterium]